MLLDRVRFGLAFDDVGGIDAIIAGAQRVVREAAQRIPWLVDELAKGGGNDPRVIDYFVRIAKARGYV